MLMLMNTHPYQQTQRIAIPPGRGNNTNMINVSSQLCTFASFCRFRVKNQGYRIITMLKVETYRVHSCIMSVWIVMSNDDLK